MSPQPSFRGAAQRREPGIHNSQSGDYGFRAPSLSLGPRNDSVQSDLRHHAFAASASSDCVSASTLTCTFIPSSSSGLPA